MSLLTIFNKETGVEVARVNLPEILVSSHNTAEALCARSTRYERERHSLGRAADIVPIAARRRIAGLVTGLPRGEDNLKPTMSYY